MQRSETKITVDWLIVIVYFLLVTTGWLVLYSVNSQTQADSLLKLNYIKQLIWIVVSLLLSVWVIFSLKPYQIYTSVGVFYVAMLFLSVIVALVADPVKGARSWIRLGGFSIQPAEFLKMATALAFAKIVSVHKKELYSTKTLLLSFLPVIFALGAVMLQGDMGTALVFGAFVIPAYREGLLRGMVLIYGLLFGVFFFVSLVAQNLALLFLLIYAINLFFIFIEYRQFWLSSMIIYLSVLASLHFINVVFGLGISALLTISVSFVLATLIFAYVNLQKIRSFASLLIIFLLGSGLFLITYFSPLLYDKLQPHQKARIEYYIHPEKLATHYSTQDVSYNIRQAILSISAGGIKGRGYLKGTHNKLKFVPEQDKDYIFCTVAEEMGFWGSVIMFLLFFALFVLIFRVSERHKSVFVRVYGYSLLGILFFHFAINLGSTLTLLPVIGIPLPFYSYGGSAMLNFTLMLALLLNFDRYRNISFEDVY